MQSNFRAGVRQIRPSAAHLVRTQNACTSCSGQRSIAQSASKRRAVPFSLNAYSAPQDERDERVVRMLMFGKPGAGKGTLTTRLAAKYDILTLSSGDLLRQHIADRTEVGLKAEEIVARGGLLPDEMVLKVVTSKLDALQNKVRFFQSHFSCASDTSCSIGFSMAFLEHLFKASFWTPTLSKNYFFLLHGRPS